MKEDLRQKILTNELGDLMLDMVTPVYDNSKVALYIFQAIGEVLEKETDFVKNDYIKQIFPQTATWAMDMWEEEYGIITDVSKTIEERRAYFMSLIFDRPPMTPKRIESIVKGITGFECELTENVATNTFHIRIAGYLYSLSELRKELDKKIPAHLIYTILVGDILYPVSYNYTATGGSMSERIEKVEVIN